MANSADVFYAIILATSLSLYTIYTYMLWLSSNAGYGIGNVLGSPQDAYHTAK